MKVLQIANGYMDKALYKNLFDALSYYEVDNQIFVPVQYGDLRVSNEKNVCLVQCFGKLDRIFFFPKQRKMINAVENQYNLQSFDIVHAHTLFSTGYTAFQIKKKYNIPYIVAVRNTDVNLFFAKQPHLRKIGINIMKAAASVVFLSKCYANSVIEKYVPNYMHDDIKKKCVIIPNGIDDYYLDHSPQRVHPLSSELKLIYVGDIDENKNIVTTISAIRLLNEEGITASYLVIGEVKNKKVKEQIDKAKFARYIPKSPKEVVRQKLQESDIFVMPSFKETFGLVYAEAMSQGIPVIYTRNQGFDGHFIEGEVGYSVNPLSPNDIAMRIRDIRNNYTAIAQNCLTHCKDFRWKEIAYRYKQLYKNGGQL